VIIRLGERDDQGHDFLNRNKKKKNFRKNSADESGIVETNKEGKKRVKKKNRPFSPLNCWQGPIYQDEFPFTTAEAAKRTRGLF
jgi:hypothetical protein